MNSWYLLMIYGLIILLLLTTIIIFLIKLIIAILKKQSLKTSVISLTISIILLTLIIVFYLSHSTYYKYNDWYILGNNISKVQEKYGTFDFGKYQKGKKGRVGYYIYTDNGPIMPDHLDHYYYIDYDEDGVIYNVQDAPQKGG